MLGKVRLSSPDNEQRLRAILSSVVEDNRINYLEFIKLSHTDKKAVAKGLVGAGVLTNKHKTDSEIYSVSFKNLGRVKFPCLFFGAIDNNITLFACSLEDASALASSWNLTYSMPACIDRIYAVGGEIMTEEVEILENDFRGKDWTNDSLLQEQQRELIPELT